jgi:hypothetical protein
MMRKVVIEVCVDLFVVGNQGFCQSVINSLKLPGRLGQKCESVRGRKIDTKFAFQNGVFDVKNGEFAPPRSDDFVTKFMNHDFTLFPEAGMPHFRTLWDNLFHDGPLVAQQMVSS